MTVTAVDLDGRWSGVDGMFGGHVFSTVADAAVSATGRRLATLSLCFVASVKPGAAEVDVTPLHAGRRTTTARIELHQEGRLRVHGVTHHATPTGRELHARTIDVPERPPTSRHDPEGHLTLTFRQRLETVLVTAPTLGGTNGAWVRFRERPSSVGVHSPEGVLSTLLDVSPPGLFSLDPKPWYVPTLSFSAHFGRIDGLDPTEWMYLTHATAWATESLCVDEATVWSSDGALLAQGRQTRSVRWPT